MKKLRYFLSPAVLAAVFAILTLVSTIGPTRRVGASVTPAFDPANNFTVVATGLNNPRGLKFGPDGNLYVAEGGKGGTNSAPPGCTPVPTPVGPYLGSNTGGRISKFDSSWVRSTVIDTLPSSQTSPMLGSLVSGVADVAFIGNTLYALLAGAGCSHGVTSLPNGIVRINANGTPPTLIADLSAFQQANPVKAPNLGDFEPDGTWYSMVAVRGDLYAVEPNHGEVDKITPSGQITRVVDLSATVGHIVPTALTYKGNFFFGNLGIFPVVPGSQQVRKLTPSGQHKAVVTGLTTVLGLVFDHRGRLYVLESMTNAGAPDASQAGSGKVVRVDLGDEGEQGDDDEQGDQNDQDNHARITEIATGLSFPGGMTLGPDGNLYVSNISFGAPPGAGQIVRIEIPKASKHQMQSNSQSEVAPRTDTGSGNGAGASETAPRTSVFLGNQVMQDSRSDKEIQENDLELERNAVKKLREDSDLGAVSVTVTEGRAVMNGTVYSVAAKEKAAKLLQAMGGIKSINNQIYVSGP